MCDATTIAAGSLAINVIGGVAEHQAQANQARQNEANALAGYRATYSDLETRKLEESQSATQEKQLIAKQSGVARGTAAASAASGGVGGLSVDLLLREIEAEAGLATDVVSQNLESTTGQLTREQEAARLRARSQVNQVPYPGVLPLTIKTASAGLEFASFLDKRNNPT